MQTDYVYNMDCIAGMREHVPDKSIDMILTDPPYGMTDARWDSAIPFPNLWKEFERVIKPNGAILLTCIQPFTTQLIMSNRKLFRFCWYWRKNCKTGFPFAKVQPLRCIEDIAVFYKKKPTYHPQGLVKLEKPRVSTRRLNTDSVYRQETLCRTDIREYVNYPSQLLEFSCERGLHPTQKPTALFEYLIRTYTDKEETVLDACMGSGTTAKACIRSGRYFVGFETDPEYFRICEQQIEGERGHGNGLDETVRPLR